MIWALLLCACGLCDPPVKAPRPEWRTLYPIRYRRNE